MQRRATIAVWLGLLLPLTACSAEGVGRPPPPPVNWAAPAFAAAAGAARARATERERAVASAYTEALASPGFVALGPILDEMAHFTLAGARDARGRDAVLSAHEALFGAFGERKFLLRRVFRTDRSQALEWTMSGVHVREFMGVAATQRPVTIQGLSLLWTNDDGGIVDVHAQFDQAVIRAQLGVGPKSLLALPRPEVITDDRKDVEQDGTPNETANVAVVRRALSALEGNDDAAYLATLADDVEVHTLERAQPVRGKLDAKAQFKGMTRAIGQLSALTKNAWGFGAFVVIEYLLVGEQRGPFGWIPVQKDTVLKMSVVDVVELREGHIARVWRYDNPAQILSQP